jgi:hypothetical protein
VTYGFEYSTDQTDHTITVKRFSSRSAALKWLQAVEGPQWAYPGAANSALPPTQQNWHKRVREIHTMPPRWRPPTAREVSASQRKWGGSMYTPSAGEVLRNACYRDALREEAGA